MARTRRRSGGQLWHVLPKGSLYLLPGVCQTTLFHLFFGGREELNFFEARTKGGVYAGVHSVMTINNLPSFLGRALEQRFVFFSGGDGVVKEEGLSVSLAGGFKCAGYRNATPPVVHDMWPPEVVIPIGRLGRSSVVVDGSAPHDWPEEPERGIPYDPARGIHARGLHREFGRQGGGGRTANATHSLPSTPNPPKPTGTSPSISPDPISGGAPL